MDEAHHFEHTTDGGYIVLGSTSSIGNGGYDVWLVKTDSNGNEEWNQTFGGSGDDFKKWNSKGYGFVKDDMRDLVYISKNSSGFDMFSE